MQVETDQTVQIIWSIWLFQLGSQYFGSDLFRGRTALSRQSILSRTTSFSDVQKMPSPRTRVNSACNQQKQSLCVYSCVCFELCIYTTGYFLNSSKSKCTNHQKTRVQHPVGTKLWINSCVTLPPVAEATMRRSCSAKGSWSKPLSK